MSKMDFTEQKYKSGNTSVKFEIDDELTLDELKNGNKASVIMIKVHQDNEHIASYCLTWDHTEKPLNMIHYNNFIKNFLTDPEYRQTLEHDGEWADIIEYDINGINKKCLNAIKQLKEKKKPKFKDFANLKTYGRDKFSSMKREELLEYVNDDDVNKADSIFDSENERLKAIRWNARGLPVDMAIRKVKTDAEIQENKNKKI